jgi:hypothetical protein
VRCTIGRSCPTCLATVLLVICGLLTGVAQAATVVLVRSPRPSAVTAEATVRLRGELVSAGFDVRVIDPPIGADIRVSLERAAAGPDVEAVVAILGDAVSDPFEDSAELWVIDRVTGKTVVRRVPSQPGSARAAEVLSIRALELLRASFLEVALAGGRTPTAVARLPPPEVTRFADEALTGAMESHRRAGWAVEVGGCVLGSLEGFSPSLVPLVRIQRSVGEHLLGRFTLAGLGTQSHVDSSQGTAEVSQQFGLAEVAVRFRLDERLQPFFSVGAGALHVTAVGRPASIYEQGLTKDRFALLADVGTGLRLAITRRFELALEAHGQVAHPYPTVRFFGVDVASEGRLTRPMWVGSLTAIAWM